MMPASEARRHINMAIEEEEKKKQKEKEKKQKEAAENLFATHLYRAIEARKNSFVVSHGRIDLGCIKDEIEKAGYKIGCLGDKQYQIIIPE